MSSYGDDPRVIRERADLYRIPSPDGDDWTVRRDHHAPGGWGATSARGQVDMADNTRYPQVARHRTADEAIGRIIGEPNPNGDGDA